MSKLEVKLILPNRSIHLEEFCCQVHYLKLKKNIWMEGGKVEKLAYFQENKI